MSKKISKIHSLLLVLVMVVVIAGRCVVPVYATVTNEDTIKIKDAEDLLEFASNCTLDSWSQGKTVILQADIYLDDVDFAPIPTFGGIFDGKGHSIIGLEVADSVSPAGLFSVIQEDAVVKNLNVTGNVTPSGENSTVGGVAGENYGEVKNCTFTGTVSGTQNVGGIVGSNGYTGEVANCRVNGEILGESMTGGIAGYNQGSLLKCKNDADVNHVSVDSQISIDNIDLDIALDVKQWSTENILDVASDTGGIAGYSTGIIQGCSNAGTVGYPHIGYNLGGIAGRSCGYVTECTNDGEIFGRKDVGGIVGQMEPYILVELSESGISQIQGELNALDQMLGSAVFHTNESSATLQRRISKIRVYMDDIQKSLEEITEAANGEEGEKSNQEDQDVSEGLSGIMRNSRITELQVQMDILTRHLQLLTGETVNSAGTLGTDLKNIAGQAGKLSNTFKAVMQEAQDLALSDYVADISEINLEEATFGKVVNCINNEKVYADKNVGGIAGNMSVEYELDPEDDVTAELSLQERQKYKLTTIIYKCKNHAAVTAKKSYVGGICGRMDLGVISESEGYGYVSSESGDYVGGIVGLAGSTVQKCFVKCSLSGRNYIGGVVGSGVSEDATGESSLVSQCYTLVDVLGYQQFAGSIAGVNVGEYAECYFVSEDLPGINRISYEEKAEPITYEELLEVADLPEQFELFTLSFVANNEVVYATTFEYGDSFEEDIFPKVPVLYGVQGQWDMAELKNLQKDTVVTAVYTQYFAALDSEVTREDGRPVFLAEGQFGEDGILLVKEEDKDFELAEVQSVVDKLNSVEVLEQWNIEVPEDGLLIHTLRYLAPETDADALDIYVKQDGDWKLASRDAVGSYLLFNIAGTDAEIAVVATEYQWWIWLAGAAAILIVIGGGIWMVRKKKDILKWLIGILAAMLIVLGIIMVIVLMDGKLVNGAHAYQLLEEYLAQPKQVLKLQVQAKTGDDQYDMEADILCRELDGRQITCVEISGAKFFYTDGILYLENGNAYQASEVSADYGSMLEQVAALYQVLDIEAVKEENSKLYKITVQEENAQEILAYLLPKVAADALEMQTLEAELLSEEDALKAITFTSKGKLQNAEKTKYDITAMLTVAKEDDGVIEIPEPVKNAMESEETKIQAIITGDVFRLYHAWEKLYAQNPMGAQIFLAADCGPLNLKQDVMFISAIVDDSRINCVRKDDFAVYFNEDTICSEKGYSVTTKRAETVDVSELVGMAYELCLQGNFRCTEVNDSYIYSIVLDEEGMKNVASLIAKESADMAIEFENGSLQLVIKEQKLESIRFACDGELDVLLTKVAVALSAELEIHGEENFRNYSIPEKVLEKLAE